MKEVLRHSGLGDLENIDVKLINLLQEDSRLSFIKIAKKLGLSTATAIKYIRNLERKGVVKGYTAIVDPLKIGYDMTAIIFIQSEGNHRVDLENEIAQNNNVFSIYDVTGGFDIAVLVRFKNRAGLNAFAKKLSMLPHVKRIVTNVALNVVKEDFKIKIS